MKSTLLFACLLGSVVAFSGCNFVMAPESPDERAGVSFVVASLSPTDDGSVPRAVVQGAGFLYIRTIGGPVGDTGPCYGPYTVSSGDTFRTKDIPPGDFDQILIMHSAKQLFTDATYDVDGKNMTFRQIMSMKDADMIEFLNEDGDNTAARFKSVKDALGSFFDGQACMGIVSKVTLPANKTTKLTVTLTPITSEAMSIELEKASRFAFPKADSTKRAFYQIKGLYGVTSPVTAGFVGCKLNAVSSGATVGAVAFYDDGGNLVASTKNGSSLADSISWRIDAAAADAAIANGQLRLYLYIEYSGEVSASFVATIPPYVTFGFKGDGSAAWKNKRMLMGFYGDATRDSLAAGGSWATQTPVSTAILDLDENGNGLAIFKSSVEAGKNYYFSAQVDSGGHYASLTDLKSVDIATIIPYMGDYVSKGDPALMALKVDGLSPFKVGNVVETNASSFELYDSPVYFVANGGSGANDGTSPASPKAFDATFITGLPTNSQVYVLDSLTGLYGMSVINKTVSIKSYGKITMQLNASPMLSGSLFTIGSNSSLRFEDIEINASGVSALTMPIIEVTGSTNCSLYLGPRSSIWGKTSGTSTTAGGVNVYPNASVTMFGSGIYQCYGSQAGALLIGMNATADLRYSTFRFNADGGTSASAITYNGQVTAKGLTISDNTPDASSNVPENLGSGTWINE